MASETKREPTAADVLQWIIDNKPGPDRMGGEGWVRAKIWVEDAIRELSKAAK